MCHWSSGKARRPCQGHSSGIGSRELSYVNTQAAGAGPDGLPCTDVRVAVKTSFDVSTMPLQILLVLFIDVMGAGFLTSGVGALGPPYRKGASGFWNAGNFTQS